MQKVLLGLVLSCGFVPAVQAQLKKDVLVTQRSVATAAPKKSLSNKPFTLAEVSATSGRAVKPTEMVKTVSGKSIPMDEYLKRVNKLEAEMEQKGYTLRNFKPTSNNLVRKPVVVEEVKINAINTEMNRSLKPLSNLQTSNSKVFFHKGNIATSRASLLTGKNAAAIARLKEQLNKKPETIEKVYDVDRYLKVLADKIQAELNNDDAELKLANAALTVRSYAAPPANATLANSTDVFSATESEYKVAVTFGASMKVSVGLPINLTIPLATMNGEFVAPAKTSKNLSRKVVVNLLGRSLFNRTSAVNGNVLDEEFTEELDIAELLNSPAMSTVSFMDWIPSVGFNTDVSTAGGVGCTYKADMTRSNVDAYIGPTYSARLRVAAKYGLDDILEGGIEGIVTLLQGGLGFGGNAGLDYEDNKWKLVNKAYIESTLEALKGEVNFFVKYPDFGNWACGTPCIKTERLNIFKVPAAFKLRGTLLEDDNTKVLNW